MGIIDIFRRTDSGIPGVKTKDNKSKSPIGILLSAEDGSGLNCPGYTNLANNPEVFTACRRIASLISSMPIMLMENGENGDTRIFNELSRKLDIEPNKYMTRRTFVEAVTMNLMLYGRGNSVVRVKTRRGLLDNLEPIPASRVSILPAFDGKDYEIIIDGKSYRPDDVLHFVDNPDPNYPYKGKGLTVVLKDAANNLRQASVTKKGFMSTKWKPPIIVKVDSIAEEFASKEGRQQLLEKYIETTDAGEPWIIPAEQFDVEVIKPLSLADLAIADSVEMDKRTVAAIMGVPPFVLGVGEYDQTAWNAFVANTVRVIAQEIEQELTRKLILNPKWYLKFNIRSLMDWDIKTIAEVFGELRKQGVVDGNEVRDQIGMSPREGLNELVMLENYIPTDKLGDQAKLNGGS